MDEIAARVAAEEPAECETNAISQKPNSPSEEGVDTRAPNVSEPAVNPTQENIVDSVATSIPPEPSAPQTTPPPPPKTQQEITLSELKAQKAALLKSLANLPAIQVLIEENALSQAEDMNDDGEATEKDISMAANRIVKDHIKLLHEYNELKDVGQGLMGLIADQRGVRIVEVQDEFGIEGQD